MTTDGLVIVDKPAGWTSHDVVARLRRLAGTRRVGHAGTLDPMATGVLVLGVGAGTKLLTHLILTEKAYAATIRFGQATVTDDAQGETVAEESASAAELDETALRAAITGLTGQIMQVPSAVSAIKVDGQRAYARVRAGESVALAARPVTVSRFDLVAIHRPSPDLLDVDVVVECSSGTYVRALARDAGRALGTGAHLTALRRTRVGPFDLAAARGLDALAELEDPVLLPMPDAVAAAMPVRTLAGDEARELSFGRSLPPLGITGTHAAVTPERQVVALLAEHDGRARPVVVFAAAG